tara:strand:+ start:201 stop:392 length:192 start_codon:yes stop_codon:yes gene_type:complete
VPWRIFGIPFSIVNIVRKVEKFLVLMGWYGQVSREKNLSMEKLIDVVLNMWHMLKNEVRAEVS